MKINQKSERTCWAEYRDGFSVELRYVARAQLKKMRASSLERRWDPRTHQQVETVDDEKFYALIAKDVVINWRGLTGDVLKSMVDMDDYPPAAVPYSEEFCINLLQNAYDFELWLMNVATEISAFEASRRAAEAKNS